MFSKRKFKIFLIIVSTVLLLITAGWYWFAQIKDETVIVQDLANKVMLKRCEISSELKTYELDDFMERPDRFFSLQIKLPPELFKKGYERGAWEGSESLGLPFYKRIDYKTVMRYFTVTLDYAPHILTLSEWINMELKSANEFIGYPSSQVIIKKISQPQELFQKGLGSIECIADFWNNVDEVYLVEPKTQEILLKYFEQQGIAHQPIGEDMDIIRSPFGIYAAKFFKGAPIVLRFSWAQDDGSFFKDKSYLVFDIFWSIRFGTVEDKK